MDTFDLESFLNTSNNLQQSELHRYSVAPMLDVSNRYFRVFIRMLSKKATLYTEMIHCKTILFNKDLDQVLGFDQVEKPLVFQIGGSEPEMLAKAAKIVEKYGYDEINLNCGCPSPKVTKNNFGASLMKEPKLVAECLLAMKNAVSIPVSVKCRLGVDDFDDEKFLKDFIEIVYKNSGIDHFIIHARKAFLKGLNPKQNRNVPPLIYDRVCKMQQLYPKLKFSINGGIKEINQMVEFIEKEKLYGVMIGRASYNNIWHLSQVDQILFKQQEQQINRFQILIQYGQYLDRFRKINWDSNFNVLIKPALSLFSGIAGNKKYRHLLIDKQQFLKSNSYSKFFQEIKINFQNKQFQIKLRSIQSIL